jgi:hypothetical protein
MRATISRLGRISVLLFLLRCDDLRAPEDYRGLPNVTVGKPAPVADSEVRHLFCLYSFCSRSRQG